MSTCLDFKACGTTHTSAGIPIDEDPLSDFRRFLFLVWAHLGLPAPTDIQYDLARYLQVGPARAIIEAFRGVGKSWITSAFVCWILYMNPQLNILVVSASKSRADDFSTFTLRLISEMDILAHLIPQDGQRQSKIAFDVAPARASHAPSVKSLGITSQIAGSRADVIIPDDVEVPNNSMTQTMRAKLAESVKEFDAVLKPGGVIRYLGTPQTEMSLYNVLPARGYSIRIWPARYPSAERQEKYGTRLAPRITRLLAEDPTLATACGGRGAPTDPGRFSDFDLLERELSYGRSGFALQFMLDTSLADADLYPLRISDLVIMEGMDLLRGPESVVWASGVDQRIEHLPNVALDGDTFYRPMATPGDFLPFTGGVMVIDPSGRGGDETGYCVAKMLNANIFVPAAGGLTGGYSEATLKALVEIAKLHKVNLVIIESNFGDGMFTELIKPYFARAYPVGIEEVRHSKQKELRIIDTLEPVMNQHRLIIDASVIEKDFASTADLPVEKQQDYQLIFQMTRINKLKGSLRRDDRLDALAMAVAYWVEQMGLDQDRRLQDRRDDIRELELQRTFEMASSRPDLCIVLSGRGPVTGLEESENGGGWVSL